MNEKIILAILGSGAFTTIVNAILNAINKRNEAKSNVNKALMCLLGYELKKECIRLVKLKSVEFDDLEQLEELNKLYHEMGGNGYVKRLMEKVEMLEVQND